MKKTLKDIIFSLLLYCTSFLVTFVSNYIIARKIGPSLYGDVNLSQNIILYFSLLIAFGFDITASREIIQAKGNHKKIELIFNKVIISRLFLLLFASFLFALILLSRNVDYSEKILLISTFSITLGFVTFPMWYFLGIQKSYMISICTLIPKIISLFAIILFVKEKSDYILINFISGVSYSLVGVFTLIAVIRENNFKIYFLKIELILQSLKKSFSVCLSNLIDNLYFTLSLLLIQSINYTELGYFSAVHKLIEISKGIILIPIGLIFFPLVSIASLESKVALSKLLSKIVFVMGVVGISGSIALFFLSELIIKLAYGVSFEPSISILQKISPIIFLLCVNNIVSRQGLEGIGKDKQRLLIVLLSGFLSYFLMLFYEKSIESIIIALQLTELFSILFSVIMLRQNGVNLVNGYRFFDLINFFKRR